MHAQTVDTKPLFRGGGWPGYEARAMLDPWKYAAKASRFSMVYKTAPPQLLLRVAYAQAG